MRQELSPSNVQRMRGQHVSNRQRRNTVLTASMDSPPQRVSFGMVKRSVANAPATMRGQDPIDSPSKLSQTTANFFSKDLGRIMAAGTMR